MTTSVWAFEPREGDAFYVAERSDDLHERAGEYVGAEQCDDCGGSLYRIEQNGRNGHWIARCVTDELGRGDCGATYAIRLRDDDEVIFP